LGASLFVILRSLFFLLFQTLFIPLASGQQNKIWACGFWWFTGPVGLWSEKFFVKTALGQRKSGLIRQVHFIWNFLCQDKKNVTFSYRWLLNRGYVMDRFDWIKSPLPLPSLTGLLRRVTYEETTCRCGPSQFKLSVHKELMILIKIRSFTCCIWLTCRGVRNLKKPHYGSHANDPNDPQVMNILTIW
jgi:hypothetical protein